MWACLPAGVGVELSLIREAPVRQAYLWRPLRGKTPRSLAMHLLWAFLEAGSRSWSEQLLRAVWKGPEIQDRHLLGQEGNLKTHRDIGELGKQDQVPLS